MLDKAGTFKQARRNSDGQCENETDRNFDKDPNTDLLVVPSYNTLKVHQQDYLHQQQLLHYLHYQQLQGTRYHTPLHPRFYSHCCRDEQSGHASPVFNIGKTELRSIEKRGFLSPSHKEFKEERVDGAKPEGYGDYGEKERRILEEYLGLQPNTDSCSLKRPHEDFKLQARYHNRSNGQEQLQHVNSEQKMDNEGDVDIKVDDIEVDFETEEKFNYNDSHSSSNISSSSCINGRISCSSHGSDSVCSGDEDDVDSGIDGGRQKDNNNNNNNNNNNISLKTTELKIVNTNSTEIYTDTETVNDFNSNENNSKINSHDMHQINNDNNKNKTRETLPGECETHTPDSLPRDQGKKLSEIFTHEDAQNPPDLTRKFTNFFIDDILKPEFGKKPFDTGTTTIRTLTPVVRSRLNKSFPSRSSFPFSISSLSQSSLLSSSSSPSINSQNSRVTSPGKKKGFSRYGSDSRCLPSKSSASLSSLSAGSLDSSRSLQTESGKQQTLSPNKTKKDLTTETPVDPKSGETLTDTTDFQFKYPAWVFCTRYSDRPSSGPRSRKMKRKDKKPDEKRPRTAFTPEQLQRLKREFDHGRYLTEERRQALAKELGLNESQIKIWFQNKRAKMKKVSGTKNPLALQLIAEGLYNHQTNKE